jgi:hypothetical protein
MAMLQILGLARETRDRQFAKFVREKQPFQAKIALTGNCCIASQPSPSLLHGV